MVSSNILDNQTSKLAAQEETDRINNLSCPSFNGKGIITCAGSRVTLYNLHFLVRSIRHFNCDLPIEVYHLSSERIPDKLVNYYKDLNVTFINGSKFPHRRLSGWELKAHAIINSKLNDVIFLDSDNIVGFNISELFSDEYKQYGSLFWADLGYLYPHMKIFEYIDCKPKTLRCFEAGQFVIDKTKTWKALNFAHWMNQNSDWFYHQKIYGDKDTFNLAWNKFETPFLLHKEVAKESGIFIHKFKDKYFWHQNDSKKRNNSDFGTYIPLHKELNSWKKEYIKWMLNEDMTDLFELKF